MVTDDERDRRLPVWLALSELFLDTQLQADDYRRIARTLSASGFDMDELHRILEAEVAPAFVGNLLSVAGEWAGWSEDEVRRHVERQLRSARPMRRLRRFLAGSHVRDEWAKIRPLLDGSAVAE